VSLSCGFLLSAVLGIFLCTGVENCSRSTDASCCSGGIMHCVLSLQELCQYGAGEHPTLGGILVWWTWPLQSGTQQ
jgi:hypothetical protein